MTADIRTAGAASHAAEGWHTINWKSAYRIVCRLQARIVKAIQEGRWGKVCTFPELSASCDSAHEALNEPADFSAQAPY